MQSAPWIQVGVILSLVYVGIFFLLDPVILFSEKAPFFALLAAAGLIAQQIGRMVATAEHRIDWIDNASLLLAAFYAGCSGWFWLAAEAGAADPAWFTSIVVLILMAITGFVGWLAYKLFGNRQAGERGE